MLADDLIEDKELRENMGDGHARLCADIQEAQRFELSKDFAGVTDQLARENVTSFFKILPLANLPFSSCWFEVAFADRPSFVGGTVSDYFHSEPVSRVGFLVQSDPENPLKWTGSLCWSFRSGICSISTISIVMDRSDNAEKRQHVSVLPDEDLKGMGEDEIAAMVDIESRAKPTPCRYYAEVFNAERHRLDIQSMLESALQDWNGEIIYWMAAVALINARNVASVEEGPDRTKLSKARLKKGRPPLMDFSVCKIAPRIASAYKVSEARGSGIRTHFVRGHFKARKSGIFWWTNHIRGHGGEGVVEKRYAVE